MEPGPLDAKLQSALGGRTASAFERAFGMRTVGDLLAHAPRRYAKRGELTAIDELAIGEAVTIVAEVRKVASRTMRQRRGSILEVEIGDGRGILTLTFFNQAWREKELQPGVRGVFAGKVGDYRGQRQLAHPDYELFDEGDVRQAALAEGGSLDDPSAKAWAEQPVPIYPATSTIPSWKVAQAVQVVLDTLPELADPVPDAIRGERRLVSFRRALEQLHRPRKDAEVFAARDALRFQEAFVLQTALLRRRAEHRAAPTPARVPGALSTGFDAALPFELTGDQRLVGEEIERDLASGVPMNRLVQGEVGSGKTLVALRAMLAVADSGGQSALLAPTEVLAAQHHRSIVASLGPELAARLRPVLLTGQLPAAERRKALLAAASGSASIVVGTHALLGEQVSFAELGLVVVDEQHRFGVDQREALRLKGGSPHVLVLTATPIPRTVAMTVFGDLDTSTITELPKGRSPIASHVVPLADAPGWEPRIWARMAEELAQGRQAFIVCPAIDQRDAPDPELDGAPADGEGGESAAREPGAAVLSVLEYVRSHPALAGRRVEPLHGRMSSEEKEATMRAFADASIDVLVATTVIEVGVDVPNASTMVVLDADRFGVSQLHQLRGRVGRGGVPGLCLFVTRAEQETVARERVEAVAATLDGFELAEVDLELRREGDVLGDAQSGGRSSLRFLRVVKDGELIGQARELAAGVLEEDPELSLHPALREALARRLDESERAFLAKS
ncbi:ATP-dependent DNA helicase RecG [Homoserinibacter sp. YIM 151385]|uniref:ATP-dependent DNA helicase RecG n=1 Tax=Homoserinibacter sp. YIM 151385 TaxID=2985506 RepID=UPI0022F09CCD|nr:ATP-dependent DNA helicase RecG [Homoserinibacter sp. YIM 151385]WBU39214.1 ATP-dependent DNA helicase RecG [Homoserinibacter sp. YIM 151385]